MMARRRSGLIEEMFDAVQQLPWWGGLIAAGIVWLVGQIVLARLGAAPMQDALRPLFKLMFNGLAIVALIAAAVSAVKSSFRKRLLDRQRGIESLRALSWQEFELLVGEAYRRQGYVIEETGGGGADGGVDLVLHRNGERILVQCKRWRTQKVGVDKVRELFGVMMAEKAHGGILVSSGRFTNEAASFAAGKALTLVDGPALARLVQDVQPAGQPEPVVAAPAAAAPEESGCPKCGSPMVLRTARRGANAGTQFYGCSSYPKCRGIRAAT